MSTAANAENMARMLLDRGYVKHCNRMLLWAVLDCKGDVMHIAEVLHALRLMIAAGDTTPDPRVRTEGDVPRNPVLAEFIAARGPQLLALLPCAACAESDATVLWERAQLTAMLERMEVVAPAAAETADQAAQRRQAMADARAFAEPRKRTEMEALDAYIALQLEKCGYPPRFHISVGGWWNDSPASDQ